MHSNDINTTISLIPCTHFFNIETMVFIDTDH